MIMRSVVRVLVGVAGCVLLATVATEALAKPRPKPKAATPTVEELLRRQEAALARLEAAVGDQGQRLEAQGEEIRQLRQELAAARAGVPPGGPSAPAAAAPAGAPPAVGTDARAKPAPDPAAGDTADEWWRRVNLEGELRFRAETTFDRGLDRSESLAARDRLFYRLRLRLTEKIDEHADWGLYLTSGDLGTGSQNQTLTGEFSRKPIGIQAAYLHYTTATNPVALDVTAGKYLFPWELPSVTFSDHNVSAEGLTETVKFSLPERSKLRSVSAMTWQLPFVERPRTRDAYVYGGQLETDWQWSKNWSTTAWDAVFDFSDFPVAGADDPIASISRGPEFLTTNIVETRYDGWGPRGDSGKSRWELLLRPELLHREGRLTDGRDGYAFQSTLGRIEEKGDWLFDNTLFRTDRDVLPDFFIDGSGVDTNTEGDVFATSYMLQKQIWVRARYFLARRVEPLGSQNRLFNRFQFDVRYVF